MCKHDRALSLRRIASLLGSVGLLMAAVACGNSGSGAQENPEAEAEAETGNTTLQQALAQTEPTLILEEETQFLRVNLRRSGSGAVSTDAVSAANLTQLALPSFTPEYLLVAYAGSEVLSAAPVSFPTAAIGVGWEGDEMVHSKLELSDSTCSAFLAWSSEIDRIALLDADGTSVLEVTEDELPEFPSTTQAKPSSEAFGEHVEPLLESSLETKYPQIHFAKAGSDETIPSTLLTDGKVVNPTEAHELQLDEALQAMTPLLRASVQTIVWIEWPSNSPSNVLLGVASGSLLALNAGRAGGMRFRLTVVHEAAHNLGNLTSAAAATPAALQNWPPEAQESAFALVRKFRLVSGLNSLFRDLHDSGLGLGYTKAYKSFCGNAATDCIGKTKLNLKGIADAGFATKYAACSECEDLAEYVSVVQLGSSESEVCNLFSSAKPLEPKVAIPYAKLVLLRGVGAISAEAFGDCTHGVGLSQESGVHFADGPSFTTDLKAGELSRTEGPSYGVFASGGNTYKLLLEVDIEQKGGTPLGLHRLDSIHLRNLGDGGLNGVYLDNDSILKVRTGAGGLLLFTEASRERTAGAIFGMVFQNAAAIDTDIYPFGTFSVP